MRDPEIDEVHEAVWCDQQVRWLDIAVDEVLGMSGVECFGGLGDDGHRSCQGQGSVPVDDRREADPFTNRMSM